MFSKIEMCTDFLFKSLELPFLFTDFTIRNYTWELPFPYSFFFQTNIENFGTDKTLCCEKTDGCVKSTRFQSVPFNQCSAIQKIDLIRARARRESSILRSCRKVEAIWARINSYTIVLRDYLPSMNIIALSECHIIYNTWCDLEISADKRLSGIIYVTFWFNSKLWI